MRLIPRLLAATLLLIGCADTGAEEEQPPAAAATEGAEMPAAAAAPAPAAATAPAAAPAAGAPATAPAATATPVAPAAGAPQAATAPAATPAAAAPAATAAPATPAANVAAAPAPQMPQLAALVIHQVKDFDAWKKVFDEDQPARKEAGVVGEGVMRGADNDKLVAIYMPASDQAKLKAFLESKDLKDKMKAAGVKGKPTVYVFHTEGGKMAPPDKTGLFGAIIQTKVKDFAAFKTAIEGEDQARANAGILGYGLGQSPDKPTEGYLYLQGEDLTKLKTYLGSKETKKAWKEAGVQGTPKTTIVKESTTTMYPK